jgi:hypothetical protein
VAAQRNAGQEGRAQHLEHRLKSGQPLTAKARQAQAQQLATQRQQARQAPLSEEEFQGRLRAITERVRKQNRIYPVGRTPQSRVRFSDQIKKALREDPEHQALMQRRERDLATLARPKPATTPPPAPAVVATKARPDRETRINLLLNRAGGLRREREAAGKMAEADILQGRRTKLREALDRAKGQAGGGFALKAKVQGAGFSDEGKGRTGALFDEMRGAGARDLPGQSSFLDRPERPDRLVKMGDQAVPIPTAASLKEQVQQNRLLTTMTGEGRSKIAAHLKAARAASRAAGIDPASHTSHQPGTVTELNTDLIHFDPQRFQYKLDQTDLKTGSVGSLAGVRKWDPELAGTVSVWKDPKDGKVYVINGHNRLDLARKMGVDRVAVRFLKAGDAQEARGKGALTNIAEGRGSVIDAAKFFRDSRIRSKADLENLGIPLGEAKARQGLELAGLHDNLFRRVIDGSLTPARGAIIGGVGLSDDQQMKVAMLADSKRHGGREITDTHLREIVDEVRHAPTQVKSGGGGLFGDDPEAESLALHRTALVSHVKERLGREKRLFGTVSRQRAASELTRVGNVINREESGKVSQAAAEALDTFDRLKRSTGPVSAAINRATERLATARGPSDRKAIHDQLYEEILGAVQHAHRLSA